MERNLMCYSCGEMFPVGNDKIAKWKFEGKFMPTGALFSCYHPECEIPTEKCSTCGLHRKSCENCCDDK